MDTECGKWFDEHLEKAFSAGHVTESMVDKALANLMRIHFRLGRFDKSGTAFDTISMDAVNSEKHQELARDAAQQAVVMLKNEAQTLPLHVASITGTLAVVGPNANATKTMLGNYEGIPPYMISPLQGLRELLGDDRVTYAAGCDIDSTSTAGFSAALDAVAASDAVVLVVGIDQSQEKEGRDRTSISLPGNQRDFIESVLQTAAGRAVVMVVMGGGAVCLGEYRNDARVQAILFVGYPGQAGGVGIAEAIFGIYNPSGRLTQTFYRGSFVDEVSFYDYGMRPAGDANLGRGYRFYTGDSVVYPFGFGLSYTSFDYSWIDDNSKSIHTFRGLVNEPVMLSLAVHNTGAVAGSHSVLLFVTPPSGAASYAPRSVLRGFDKVLISPGGNATVSFSLSRDDFSLANEKGLWMLERGAWTVSIGELSTTVFVV